MIIDAQTRRWWNLLRAASMLNVLLWIVVVATVDYSLPSRTAQVILSGIYTFVCAFRSFYPRIDLERIVLKDHWLSSIALGRTAATIAEMCFAVQLALVLLQYADAVPWLSFLAVAIVIVIAVAQIACWYGVLSGNHLWHAVEESLWTWMVTMIVVAGVGIWPHVEDLTRLLLVFSWIGCAVAAYVMSGLDVPMYIRRWQAERTQGIVYCGIRQGLIDAIYRRRLTGRWNVWQHEVAWMTPYFTVCVWLSLGLARFGP
jgi:hypothetical protein